MNFELSADAKILKSVLAEAKVGDTITYETLSKAIGRDVREHARSALGTARHGVLRDNKIVFGVQNNVGLVRLNDVEIVKTTESDRRKMHRTAGRALRRLESADYEALDNDSKRSHIVASAQFGVLRSLSTSASTKKIESKVSGSSDALPIGETLKLFGG